MKKNPKIVAVTAAMAEGNCLGQIAFEFPSRFFDVGICEEHATTFAAGLATQGFLPVVAIYSTFMQRAFDQLIHDVCIQDLPVVIAMDRAGIVGDDGKTHQGIFDLSYLGLIPNLVVVAPKDGSDLRQLMIEATTIGHPIAIRYPRSQTPESCMPETDEKARIGQAEILRTGTDITLLAIGTMCFPALDAARILSGLDIEASVINVRYVKPFDTQVIIQACQRSGRVITIEENVLAGGFGSSLTQYLHNSGFDTIKVRCVGIPNQFVEHGPRHVLQAKLGLDASGIVRCVLESFPELQVNRPSRQEASVN